MIDTAIHYGSLPIRMDKIITKLAPIVTKPIDDIRSMPALSCIEIADIAYFRCQYQDATHYLRVADCTLQEKLLAATSPVTPMSLPDIALLT